MPAPTNTSYAAQRARAITLVKRHLATVTARSPKGISIHTLLYERHIVKSRALKLTRSDVNSVFDDIQNYIEPKEGIVPFPKHLNRGGAKVEDLVNHATELLDKNNLFLNKDGFIIFKKEQAAPVDVHEDKQMEQPATETKEETKQENEAFKNSPFINFREHYSLKNGYFYAVANCRIVTEEAFVICLKTEGYPILYVYQQDKNNAALVDSLSQSTGFTREEILESIQTDFDKNLEVLEKEGDIVSLMLNDFIDRTVAKGKTVDLYFLTSNFTKYGSEFEFPDAAQKEARKRETLISSIASKLDPDEAAFLKSLIKVD